MKKLCISTIIVSSLVFLGCAASIAEQKGSELKPFPQAEQLKIKTARPLTLRTETQNKNCDVTTFFQIMSERNPDIQNILDVRYSEVEKNDKTECSYWGIGVTYEGVTTSLTAKISFDEPIKDTSATQPRNDSPTEAQPEVKTDALAEQQTVAPAEASVNTTKNETSPATETVVTQETAPIDSAKASSDVPTVQEPAKDSTGSNQK